MKVISLFDGMGCGLTALKRAGFKVSEYNAFEIDKHAITVAKANHPEIIHHGSVVDADFVQFARADLLIAGSPCQGFSFAGKQLAFDDPRSKLFFEFIRALITICPKYFLLENVKMAKQHLDVITRCVGVEPTLINSALVSAQNRQRYYWCNWKVEQPADRGIMLKDIIQEGVVDNAYVISDGQLNRLKTSTDLEKSFSKIDSDKAGCMTARQYANWKGNFVTVNVSSSGRANGVVESRHYISDKSHTLTANNGRYAETLVVKEATKKGFVEINANEGVDLTFPTSKTRRGRRMEDKSNAQAVSAFDFNWFDGKIIRKLTPIECERLQTLPDNYTAAVSDAQRYKMLGNGWTIDVIAHLLDYLPKQ